VPNEELVHTDRARAESFGSVAEQYDRYRPSYPGALIDDLVALRPGSILDVGCGTGKAAVLLAARGLSVLGVEIDARMAAVARAHDLSVEVGAFETWDDAGRRFDLIICGQAWHWMDPKRGPIKAAKVLRPAGMLALFWNYGELDPRAQAILDDVYRRHAPELLSSVVSGRSRQSDSRHAAELEASGRFASVETRTYQWQHSHSAADWVATVQTHSDHLRLPANRRASLAADLITAIDRLGGAIDSQVRTYALFARRER
jgi:SAM-dependent methyltransferase